MHITVQTCYDLQYITICLSGYINNPAERALLPLRHSMEYVMNYPHESTLYSRKKISKTNEIPHNCLFKEGDVEINKYLL